MKKILHLIPNLGIGGTEKILLEICKKLHGEVFQMGVISLKSGGRTAQSLQNLGVPVNILNAADGFLKGLTDFPGIFIKLRRAILNFSPDLLHTWLTRANVMGRMVAAALGFRKVVSSLRVMEMEKRYHLWAERLTQSKACAFTVNSTALKKFAIEKIKIPEAKIVLIFNGITLPGGMIEKKETHSFRIGTLGRLHKQKGIDIFLGAAKEVLEKFPESRFFVGGEGGERDALKILCKELKIQTQVSFLGRIEDVESFMRSLDIFVLASRWEGMPNVVLEAMAAGVPVVASSVAGVTDLMQDGASGILVEPGNVSSCVEGILRLMADPVLRKEIAERAYERVKKEFSLDAMLSSYKNLYERLLLKGAENV